MPESQTANIGPGSMDSWITRVARQLANLFGLGDPPVPVPYRPRDLTAAIHGGDTPTEPLLRIVEPEQTPIAQPPAHRWRRHPQLLAPVATDLAPDEREARHEAVRGLFAARAGALACAEEHFTTAAQCEAIDLTAIPGFWQLERRAMSVAVDAYEAAGRIRDASALNARIRSMYRPRALSPLPENVTQLPHPDEKASRSI
jgi:hypothetical protein